MIVKTMVELELVTEECYKCHIVFAMPKGMNERCRKYGDEFYCPNGHCQVYGRSDLTIAEDRLKEEKRRRAQVEYELQLAKGTNRALRGVITKTKKRVSKGVCPCCNRQFTNVTRHMETQHPDYGNEESEEK